MAEGRKNGWGPPPTYVSRVPVSSAAGADWLYTYLRSFTRPRAQRRNNTVFPTSAAHMLYQLQGEQVLKTEVQLQPRGSGKKEEALKVEVQKLVVEKPGTMTPAEYDRLVADLVNFLAYMAEPVKHYRQQLGIYVLMFLGVMFVFASAEKRGWKTYTEAVSGARVPNAAVSCPFS